MGGQPARFRQTHCAKTTRHRSPPLTATHHPHHPLPAKWSIASKKEKEQGAWGVARRTLAREGPRILVRGWVPMFSRLTPLYIAGSTMFEQIRIACGVGYYA